MKKTFKFFAAALAIVAAASCAKENTEINSEAGRDHSTLEMIEMTIGASIDNPVDPTNTKTTLVDGLNVNWTSGDKVLVFPYAGPNGGDNYSPFNGSSLSVKDESIRGPQAEFVGSVANASQYRAIYPHDCLYPGNCYSHTYSFILNTLRSQTVVSNDFSKASWGATNISMAYETPKEGMFEFKNMLAYLKFTVPYDNVYSVELSADRALNQDNLLADDANIGGTLVYKPEQDMFFAKSPSSSASIIANNGGKPFVAGNTYYVAIPAIQMEGFSMIVKNQADASIFQLNKTAFTPERNTIYNLGTLAPVAYVKFSNLGYGNAYVVDNDKIYLDDAQTVYCKFNQGNAGTPATYYTSDQAIRMYQNGSKLEVSATGKTILSIELTFANGHHYLAADQGTLSEEGPVRVWKGESSKVTFTSTGTDKNHRAYVSSIRVVYK